MANNFIDTKQLLAPKNERIKCELNCDAESVHYFGLTFWSVYSSAQTRNGDKPNVKNLGEVDEWVYFCWFVPSCHFKSIQ